MDVHGCSIFLAIQLLGVPPVPLRKPPSIVERRPSTLRRGQSLRAVGLQGPDVMYEKIAADTMMEKDAAGFPHQHGVIFREVVRISRQDYIHDGMVLYIYNL